MVFTVGAPWDQRPFSSFLTSLTSKAFESNPWPSRTHRRRWGWLEASRMVAITKRAISRAVTLSVCWKENNYVLCRYTTRASVHCTQQLKQCSAGLTVREFWPHFYGLRGFQYLCAYFVRICGLKTTYLELKSSKSEQIWPSYTNCTNLVK